VECRQQAPRQPSKKLAAPGVVVELTEVDIIVRGPADDAARLERQRQEFFDMESAQRLLPSEKWSNVGLPTGMPSART